MRTAPIPSPGAPHRRWVPLVLVASLASLAGCNRSQGPDPTLVEYIDTVAAVDAHAHPMAWVAPGEPPDTDFDALPLSGIPSFQVPVGLRPDNPVYRIAQEALYHIDPTDTGSVYVEALDSARTATLKEKGTGFASWALGRAHIRYMLANRIAMGSGLPASRFGWIPFEDALMLPLDIRREAARTPDTQALYPLEAKLLARYLRDLGLRRIPSTLGAYERDVVAATLKKQKDAGAVGLKFEAAYLRSLDFEPADSGVAAAIYARYARAGVPTHEEYTTLENHLFRVIARDAGSLGLTIQIHVTEGFGSYYSERGSSPLLLESAFDDPSLRSTNFVITHGGWPRVRETLTLLNKPNVYADISMMDLLAEPRMLVDALRLWLGEWPEKVLFGTDAFDGGAAQGWEQVAWVASRNARRALSVALDGMVDDGEITPARARAIARMVLRENAIRAYHLDLP
jgi:predicted TIM-barrel fold metal-dependent hydrolase